MTWLDLISIVVILAYGVMAVGRVVGRVVIHWVFLSVGHLVGSVAGHLCGRQLPLSTDGAFFRSWHLVFSAYLPRRRIVCLSFSVSIYKSLIVFQSKCHVTAYDLMTENRRSGHRHVRHRH